MGAGQHEIVLRTADGGFVWKAISSGTNKDLHGILALSDQEIYVVGADGLILHSMDGGEIWKQQHTDLDTDLYKIVRAEDGKMLWVVGEWGVILKRRIELPEIGLR